ncbi:bifunctional phosphoglucose/phosphomannose isomerase [Paenibacillus agricola]|uniref:Bifunctional phosphoglucose/phosphomannose isomerase n=1 Tax=Paenibacillus agricola TaxID=2716264 RepID=A0ABX0JHM1_9BACL|nr:bifunctional phosphoglucose/phosphomannose isomerase [Paenibacillus agricola]NHN34198.1 bifunctional phosphoglucose/phosphomannose isomerase [Paenibacillus agricola]
MKTNLDHVDALLQLDNTGLFEATANYHTWITEGYSQAKALEVSKLPGKIDEIVICSVGGGPVASLVQVKSLLFDEIKVPVILSQAYTMPAYVDADSIVFIVNYSGGSEEVVSAYHHAITTGATIVVLTAGGKAKELAEQNGHLLFQLPAGKIPRIISTSHVLVPMLVILHAMGLISDPKQGIIETISLMEQLAAAYAPQTVLADNEAKQIAAEMDGLIPVVYGTLPFTDAVAVRYKNQLAEVSKLMAFCNAMSGLHHDEANGWDADSVMLRQFHFTLIHDEEDLEPMGRRLKATREVLASRAGAVRQITSTGSSRLARMCSLTYLIDHVTLYLAFIRGINPSQGTALNEFRKRFNS